MSIICQEYAAGLVELARGGALEAWERGALLIHVERCTECAGYLEEQRSLDRALRNLASEALIIEERIAVKVLAEFDRAAASRRPAQRAIPRWIVAAALAASLSLAVFWTLHGSPSGQAATVAQAVATEDKPFLTIPYTIPLSPQERADVVRMRIPVTALLAVGFRVEVSDASAAVDADVLVSQDGRLRAVRPLTVAIFN